MTLIYGAIDKENGYLIGDSLFDISDIKDGDVRKEMEKRFSPINGYSHGLKIYILKRDLAIAYAGNVLVANETIELFFENIQKNKKREPENLLKIYSNQIKKENLETTACDFLLLDSSGDPKLFKITKNEILSVQKAYIGDDDAYKTLQKKRKSVDSPKKQYIQLPDGTFKIEPFVISEFEQERTSIQNAMIETAQTKRSTVGLIINHPFIVTKAVQSNNLIFLQYVEAGLCFYEDRYNYSLCSAENEPYGVGIHYSQNKTGYLFILGHCHKIHASDLEKFKSKVENDFGIKLL